MIQRKYLQNALIGGVAVAFGSTQFVPAARERGPVATTAISIVTGGLVGTDTLKPIVPFAPRVTVSPVTVALGAFQNVVRSLSHSRALADAFKSYFAYKSAHPDQVRKPLLYFVSYGLPATTPRGYVFDM